MLLYTCQSTNNASSFLETLPLTNYNIFLFCKGTWLQTRAFGWSNESWYSICTMERTNNSGLVRTVGWYASLVRCSVQGKCQIRSYNERSQWHGNTKGDRYQQSLAPTEVETCHSRDGVSNIAICTKDIKDNFGIWGYEPRVDWKLVVAFIGTSTIPYYIYGMSGGCKDVRSFDEERFERTTENGW